MRKLLILFSILTSFDVSASLDIQPSDWEENTEKVDQWYIEEEEGGPAPDDQKAELDTTTRAIDPEVDAMSGEQESQQDEE